MNLDRLAAVLRDPDRVRLADLTAVEAAELIGLSRAHGVEAWLTAAAATGWPSTELQQQVDLQRIRFKAAAARDARELAAFGSLAATVDCEWVAVKGQATAISLYPQPFWRYGVDVDVLVDPRRFADLCQALLAAGWRLLDRNWPLLAATEPGELLFTSPTGTLFDVHWHLMTSPRLRSSFPFETRALLGRRRSLPTGLPALSGDDQLVHLAVHAALSGANRLSWLLDTGLAATQVEDWRRLSRTADEVQAGAALELVLGRAGRWLGTPTGSSSLWAGAFGLVDRLSPLGPDPDRPSVARAFARSVRSSGPRSLLEFLRHGLAFARSGAPRQRPLSPLQDAADRRSPRHDAPDAAAQQRYFAAVG